MKPHIKKVNGWWECEGCWGRTPKLAFQEYQLSLVIYNGLVNDLLSFTSKNKGPN